jgi:hypothetical protein
MSKRTTRYLKRTIKKNNQEILNDKKHIKLLNESLKYMTDYAISSYNYNNYLVNMISNLVNNDNQTEQEVPEQEVPEQEVPEQEVPEQSNKVTVKNNLCKEDICAYI